MRRHTQRHVDTQALSVAHKNGRLDNDGVLEEVALCWRM